MICEITGYERKGLVRIKNQEEERRIWHSSNIVNLCLDRWSEKVQSGNLYHIYTREPVAFSSLFEAVNRMEELYDAISFPQASSRLRSFLVDRRIRPYDSKEDIRVSKPAGDEVREVESFDKVIEHRGTQATFLIRVMYRQHASWQGEVTWVERQKKEYFRSALELIRLLDGTFKKDGKKDAE